MKFLAEQVSHHPPVGACRMESPNFIFWQEQGLKTKFGGNSLGCESVGALNVRLKKSGDQFQVIHGLQLSKPRCSGLV
jgi:hypothetical protein